MSKVKHALKIRVYKSNLKSVNALEASSFRFTRTLAIPWLKYEAKPRIVQKSEKSVTPW